MSRSRRLGAATALPAAALAAALVLAPTTAFAAEGDPAAVDAAASTGSVPAAEAAPTETGETGQAGEVGQVTEAPASPATTSPSVSSTDPVDAVASDGGATGATPGIADEPTWPTTSAPAAEAAPTPDEAEADVVADEASVFIPATAGHPGQAFPVLTQGFTPGDLVHATVEGDDVPAGADLASVPTGLTFDDEGGTAFFVALPETLPAGGFVTVTVTDDSGRSALSDLPVTTFAAAPHLEAPVGATAGVVTVTGENAIPGGYALVEVYDADELVTDLPDPSTDAPSSDADPSVEPDPSSDAEPTGDEIAFDIPVDVDPVPYEVSGFASAVVPVGADGRFSARFVLPAGEFATDAYTFDADLTTESDFSDPALFSVAPAVIVPVATTPGSAAPAALPVRPVAVVTPARSSSLAYTGSDPSGALGWAVASVLAGAGALVAGRLRLRRR